MLNILKNVIENIIMLNFL